VNSTIVAIQSAPVRLKCGVQHVASRLLVYWGREAEEQFSAVWKRNLLIYCSNSVSKSCLELYTSSTIWLGTRTPGNGMLREP
jgi:hypothetical protein